MKRPTFKRHPLNPIVRPGGFPWRKAVTFNPAVLYEAGKFTMYERCSGGLQPFHCSIGMLESNDGVSFEQVGSEPVITPELLGSKYGSVQDPRIIKIEGIYYMTVAYRPYAWNSYPTGLGVPNSTQAEFPGFDGDDSKNQTRSAILRSEDRINWELLSWVSDPTIDDRDVILFPEKIGGRYAVLRRPQQFVGLNTEHAPAPSIQISYSDDMLSWTVPKPIIHPRFDWEDNRIGGSTPPIRTDHGWLVFYHGVENLDPEYRTVVYRMGAALLDLGNPEKVIARSPQFLMEPEEYYEKFGLYIPNVIFHTAACVIDGEIWLYYGVCDTAIALAQVKLDDVLNYLG